MTPSRERRRSVAFLEGRGETWACFLVTYPDRAGTWHGYFSFRPARGDGPDDEVRTAAIFIEPSETEVHEKARSLGRPLLRSLLESACFTDDWAAASSSRLRGRFRALLVENSLEVAGDWAGEAQSQSTGDLGHLRSLYASYRLDQVAHFVCLVEPEAFDAAVDELLGRERIDFRSKDRMQFAMIVVDWIEGLLPLPDFETWARDFLAHPEAYRLYTHTLHREGRLP